jgi:hypothetical protein
VKALHAEAFCQIVNTTSYNHERRSASGACAVYRTLLVTGDGMAKKAKRKKYKPWLATELRALKKFSREKLPVVKIEKLMKRTASTLRQKAFTLGLPLGHRRKKR